ncbi:cystein proteinase inhibitor protein salarin isoform X2 [Anthonomus grandis grandis]|uniref:cystein proteinase inhibitor protein salarin isoform X2 n=1 Tax=Anthonomus grandis grandis TaxID=2921223 RepID=UPI002166481A|nr:cystein proteinase inhibitor protein salarin isoform X2 [Anthonomus grandis grandis]
MSGLLVGPINAQEEWSKWKAEHGKSYESEEEEQKRFKIFESNVNEIAEHNRKFQDGQETYSKGLNHMADLTPEEVPKGGMMMGMAMRR